MAGRFMVFKLRDIIKNAVIFIISAAVILLAVYFIFQTVSDKKQVYMPGTYTSDIVLDNGRLTVEVKVGKNKIKSVEISDYSEEIPVFYPLFGKTAESVHKHIKKEQHLDYEHDGDTPVTSSLIMDAVERSLEEARL